MLRNTMVRWVVAILCVVVLGGCSEKTQQPAGEQEQVKTAEEYKAEANQQITEQNMNQELDKLESEVNAETAVDANQTK